MTRRNAIVVVADAGQFPPAVFVVQRLRALNTRTDADVVLASSNAELLAEARDFDPSLQLLSLTDLDLSKSLPTKPGGYITHTTYLRLFLPRLLQNSYRRILYMDADVYPQSARIFDLFDLDMGGEALAAVRDLTIPFVACPENAYELEEALKLKIRDRFSGLFGAKYLNAGVALFDVDAFVRRRLEQRMMNLLRQGTAAPNLMDQTLLNAVLKTRWLELSPSFNMIVRVWASFVRDFVPPSIVHFAGPVKPWHHAFIDAHPARTEIAAFLQASPWRSFILRANPIVVGDAARRRPPRRLQLPSWGPQGMSALVEFLRNTPFADVEQGIVTPNYAALPRLTQVA